MTTSLRPRVAFLSTGGTLSSIGGDPLDLVSYGDAGERLTTEELVQSTPAIGAVCDPVLVDHPQQGSSALGVSDWLSLRRKVVRCLDEDNCAAVVVLHGTNTLEETAYFLDLTLPVDRPVVVVGAMRPPTAIGTDSHSNLLDAARVASCRASRYRGVLVSMGGELHAPRDVTKGSTYALDAFHSPNAGPIGFVDADGVVRYLHPALTEAPKPALFEVGGCEQLPDVQIVISFAGQDGSMIDAATTLGAAGLVCAGAGAGKCSPGEYAAIERAVEAGVVVVMCSRVGSGRVVQRPDLTRRGIIAGGRLSPLKARVVLMLALARSTARSDIEGAFHAEETGRLGAMGEARDAI